MEDGTIDVEKAAKIIDLIVEIKEGILNGGPKSEIRPMIQLLRQNIQELKNSGALQQNE